MKKLLNVRWFAGACLFIVAPTLLAADISIECKPAHWPYPEHKTTRERAKLFRRVKRTKLIQYYFTEISDPKDPVLIRDMGKFLEGTEQDELMRGYFQMIEYSLASDSTSSAIRPLPLKELCERYRQTARRE